MREERLVNLEKKGLKESISDNVGGNYYKYLGRYIKVFFSE